MFYVQYLRSLPRKINFKCLNGKKRRQISTNNYRQLLIFLTPYVASESPLLCHFYDPANIHLRLTFPYI